MSQEKKLSPQARMMIVLIVLMSIGIVLRWGFIKSELGTMWDKMFPARTEIPAGH